MIYNWWVQLFVFIQYCTVHVVTYIIHMCGGLYAYVADTTTPEDRTFRMSLLNGIFRWEKYITNNYYN